MRLDTYEDWIESLSADEKAEYEKAFNDNLVAAYHMELASWGEFQADMARDDELMMGDEHDTNL